MDWVYRRNVGWKWFRGEKQDGQGLEEKGGMDWVQRRKVGWIGVRGEGWDELGLEEKVPWLAINKYSMYIPS